MASVFVPVFYVLILFGGLLLFSHFYRKRIAASRPEPYFPSHPERNMYISLLQMTDPPASDAILKAALVRRAMADVRRVVQLREDKPALQNLLQKGCIGDDLWNSLLQAEKELEAEIVEVVAEANSFVEGWGTIIFPTANEMIANERMRALYEKQIPQSLTEAENKYGVKVKSPPIPQMPAVITAGPPPSNQSAPNTSPLKGLATSNGAPASVETEKTTAK
jgi:translocation protein SEC66